MSNFDELIGRLDRIEEQTTWLVRALKHLLDPGEHSAADDFDDWLDDGPDPNEHIAVRRPQRPPEPPQCTHQHQMLDAASGAIVCAKCRQPLNSSGVVQNRLGANGQVQPDQRPPEWATTRSPGASSKNPGAPLGPHMVD